MERFWEQCIFKYLRAEPEDHYVLLVCRVATDIWRLMSDRTASQPAGEQREHCRNHV